MGVSRRAAAGVLVTLVFLAACGDGKGTARTPGAAAPRAEVVEFSGGDVDLSGFAFGSGETAVVLAHMREGAKEDWIDVAVALAENDVMAFTFDFRGYAGQTGEKDTFLVEDLTGAVQAMREQGATRVYVVGASMGGTAAVALAAEEDVAGVVAVSAPAKFAGINARREAMQVAEPTLFVVAEDDEPYAADARMLAAAAAGQLVTYDGSSHGTDLLRDHGGELTELILGFVKDPRQPGESATEPEPAGS